MTGYQRGRMESAAVLEHARRLIEHLRHVDSAHREGWRPGLPSVQGLQAQVVDLLRSSAGPRSSFVDSAASAEGADGFRANVLVSVLQAFIDHAYNCLLSGLSPERN